MWKYYGKALDILLHKKHRPLKLNILRHFPHYVDEKKKWWEGERERTKQDSGMGEYKSCES